MHSTVHKIYTSSLLHFIFITINSPNIPSYHLIHSQSNVQITKADDLMEDAASLVNNSEAAIKLGMGSEVLASSKLCTYYVYMPMQYSLICLAAKLTNFR